MTDDDGYQELFVHLAGGKLERAKEKADDRLHPTTERSEGIGTTVLLGRVEQRTGTDCLSCCMAMLTGLPYETVPDFVAEHDTAWPSACEEWLAKHGMGLLMLGATPRYVPPWLPIMAKGTTARATHHHCVVVMPDGVIDPHPAQVGLAEVVETYAVIHRPNAKVEGPAGRATSPRPTDSPL